MAMHSCVRTFYLVKYILHAPRHFHVKLLDTFKTDHVYLFILGDIIRI